MLRDSFAGFVRISNLEFDVWQLGDMESEVRGFSEPTRSELGKKIRSYKENLDTISQDIESAKRKFDRTALLGGGRGGNMEVSIRHPMNGV